MTAPLDGRSGRRNGAYNQPMHSEPICRVADIRAIETRSADQPLMERAGLAAAASPATCWRTVERACSFWPDRVTTVATRSSSRGISPRGFSTSSSARATAARACRAAAAAARAAWRERGGAIVTDWTDDRDFGLIVDGLFGIGLTRAIDEVHARWIVQANDSGIPILALDVPSGLDAETGVAQTPRIRARATATFIALKPGLVTLDGPDHCGAISVHRLDIADGDVPATAGTSARLGGAAHRAAGRAFARAPQRAQGNLRHAGRRRRQRRDGRRVAAGGARRAPPGRGQSSRRPRGDRSARGRLAAAGADAARRRRMCSSGRSTRSSSDPASAPAIERATCSRGALRLATLRW